MFATLSDDGRQATVKATREEQAALVEAWRHSAPNAWSRPTTPPNRPTNRVGQLAPDRASGSRVRLTQGRGSMRAWLLDPVRFR
jgi:hypothetical protein